VAIEEECLRSSSGLRFVVVRLYRRCVYMCGGRVENNFPFEECLSRNRRKKLNRSILHEGVALSRFVC